VATPTEKNTQRIDELERVVAVLARQAEEGERAIERLTTQLERGVERLTAQVERVRA
jgi:hypothetical protein